MTSLMEAEALVVRAGSRTILSDLSLSLGRSETVAVTGPSGSGKSTLLRVLAGIQLPDSGSVRFDGQELTGLPDDRRSLTRLRRFGFVFQFADLVPELTLGENIELPLVFLGVDKAERRRRLQEMVESVGLGQCRDQYPQVVSGGERQRAAVARALIHRPEFIFADEPTGSLDLANGARVLSLLTGLVESSGGSMVLVSHDQSVIGRCDRRLTLSDGRLRSSEDQ